MFETDLNAFVLQIETAGKVILSLFMNLILTDIGLAMNSLTLWFNWKHIQQNMLNRTIVHNTLRKEPVPNAYLTPGIVKFSDVLSFRLEKEHRLLVKSHIESFHLEI